MEPEISLLHATRGRPQQAMRTRSKWYELADRPELVEHIFAAQDDDEASADLPNLVTTAPPPKWASSSVDNWNAAARESAGRLLVVIADDLTPFKGWDSRILSVSEAASGPLVIHVSDNIRDDDLVLHPILNRQAYERLGNIFHPEYYGVFCDNDFYLRCNREGIPTTRLQCGKWHHEHPLDGSTQIDDVTALQNSQEAYRYGSDVFMGFWGGHQGYKLANPVGAMWLGSDLSLMERLTLRLLTKHGHKVNLITDRDHKDIPDGVELHAVDGFVRAVGFDGIPHPTIPNGGIGSLAHWSDMIAYGWLYKFGGAWIQMDVAATKPIIAPDYTFTPFHTGISPVCMLMPRGSRAADAIVRRIEPQTLDGWKGLDWHASMAAQTDVLRERKIPVKVFQSYVDCGGMAQSLFNQPFPEGDRPALIHWSNATHGRDKESPVSGSAYETLCKEEGLI